MSDRPLERILYVEDEPDIQAVARLALERIGGFMVETCGSGEEAMHKAPRFKPDLILLDVMMPGLDGPGTLQALRRLPGLAGVPVVFMTAKVQPEEVALLRSLGAIEVIAKPFDAMRLSQMVQAAWTRRHGS
jgi:CheY-like chemotaxis protein